MRAGAVAAAMAAAGLAGGVVGALLTSAPPPVQPSAISTGDAAPSDDAREAPARALDGRLQAVEASLELTAREAAALREALDRARADAEALRARLDAIESAGPAPANALAGRAAGLVAMETEIPADEESMRQRWAAMRNRQELLRKSEEERWTSARDALGLTAHQEETLKAAVAAFHDATRAALVHREVTDRTGGRVVSISVPDAEKMREARRAYDDAVAQALGADQARRWREEGWEGALRGGGPGAFLRQAGRQGEDGGR